MKRKMEHYRQHVLKSRTLWMMLTCNAKKHLTTMFTQYTTLLCVVRFLTTTLVTVASRPLHGCQILSVSHERMSSKQRSLSGCIS